MLPSLPATLPAASASPIAVPQRRNEDYAAAEAQLDTLFSHACTAADWDRAARLLAVGGAALLASGRRGRVGEWLARLPDAVLDASPSLLLLRARTDGSRAPAHFARAMTAFRAAGEPTGAYTAWAGWVGALARGPMTRSPMASSPLDAPQLDACFAEHAALAAAFPDFRDAATDWLVAHAALCAQSRHAPASPRAEVWRARALALARRIADAQRLPGTLYAAVQLSLARGEISRATAEFAEYAQRETEQPYHAASSLWHILAVELDCVGGRFDACIARVVRALDDAARCGTRVALKQLLVPGIHAALAQGDTARARPWLARLAADPASAGGLGGCAYSIAAAWFAQCVGETDAAHEHARAALDCALESGAAHPTVLARTVLGLTAPTAQRAALLDAALKAAQAHGLRAVECLVHFGIADLAFGQNATRSAGGADDRGLALGADTDAGSNAAGSNAAGSNAASAAGGGSGFGPTSRAEARPTSRLDAFQPDSPRFDDPGTVESGAVESGAVESGFPADGDAALAEALRLGSAETYVVFPCLPRAALARLCARAFETGVARAHAATIVRINRLRPPDPDSEHWPWAVRIYTLGRFSLVVDGEPVCFVRKPQKKTLALLQALIAFGGRDVDEWRLAEALAEPGEDSAGALAMPLLRLRKLLGHADAVRFAGGKFSLDRELCWVDAWAFERGVRAADPVALDRSLVRYVAPFLAHETEKPWMLRLRGRLQDKFEAAVVRHGECLETTDSPDRAAEWYRSAIDLAPACEPIYRRLMRCLAAASEPAEAIRIYQRCRSQLSIRLGIAPSAETEGLRRRIVELTLPAAPD